MSGRKKTHWVTVNVTRPRGSFFRRRVLNNPVGTGPTSQLRSTGLAEVLVLSRLPVTRFRPQLTHRTALGASSALQSGQSSASGPNSYPFLAAELPTGAGAGTGTTAPQAGHFTFLPWYSSRSFRRFLHAGQSIVMVMANPRRHSPRQPAPILPAASGPAPEIPLSPVAA